MREDIIAIPESVPRQRRLRNLLSTIAQRSCCVCVSGRARHAQAVIREKYLLYADIGAIPVTVPRQRRLVEVSRSVCREMCSTVYSDHCSGFLYDRQTRSCTLSPYTGNWQPAAANNNGNSSTSNVSRVEFYRRSRTLGGYHATGDCASCLVRFLLVKRAAFVTRGILQERS
jgi:PAN domain